jgi:hypothetical protein
MEQYKYKSQKNILQQLVILKHQLTIERTTFFHFFKNVVCCLEYWHMISLVVGKTIGYGGNTPSMANFEVSLMVVQREIWN